MDCEQATMESVRERRVLLADAPSWAYVSSPSARLVHQLAGHVLAFYGQASIVALPYTYVAIRCDTHDLHIEAPVGRLDASGRTLYEVPQGTTPANWLWQYALPELLPPDTIALLRSQYKLRDSVRSQQYRDGIRGMTNIDPKFPRRYITQQGLDL